MGILDDLESQPEQHNQRAGGPAASAGADEFYRAHIKQRMIMANDFFTQLVNKLQEKKPVIKAEYPFRPEGKSVTLLQQGYKNYSDNIPDPRQLTFSFSCILANPSTYDVKGHGPALAQGELLERYQFKHQKLEARDQNRMVIGARFKLQGPLQVKCVLQFDEAKQIIKLLLSNIVGPGTSQYNLKPELLDKAFMDRLGKYLLRKEASLFQEEISDEIKARLRKKLQQEQLQREAELQAVEAQRKAEETARKQNSTTQQLKNAVRQSVAENRDRFKKVMEGQVREKGEKLKKAMEEQVRDKGEKLKSMFNKLKNRTGSEAASALASASPAVNSSQAARPTGEPAVQGLPPANRQAGQTVSARQNTTPPKPPAAQNKPTPPKVFQASASNPFLKPEDFAPVPQGGEKQTEVNADAKNPTAQLPAETATPAPAKTPNQTTSPAAAQAKPTAASGAPAAKTASPSLQTKTAAVQAEAKKTTVQSPAQTESPATQMPTTSSAAGAKPPTAPVEPELSLDPIAMDLEDSTLAASVEPELLLDPIAMDTKDSTPTASVEPELLLDPIAMDTKDSSPTVPAEPELSLDPIAMDAEDSAPIAPADPEPSLDPESPALAAKTEEPHPEPPSDSPPLSLEDELERDLLRIMENDKQQPSLEAKTSDVPSSAADELDFDLSAPAALELHIEETDKASEQDNSDSKK